MINNNIIKMVYRTIGHFITPRLRVYLARSIFTAPNKPVSKDDTYDLEKKVAILILDIFSDPNFLDYLRSQAILLRMQVMQEYKNSIITLPEEQRVAYQTINHFIKASGIPHSQISTFERKSLWIEDGSVQ